MTNFKNTDFKKFKGIQIKWKKENSSRRYEWND